MGISKFLSDISKNLNELDILFLSIIAIISFLGIIFGILNKQDKSRGCANLATSMGVLGTFIGIFDGLRQFDALNIEASVPNLLEGMKFAFLTSIAGMVASIVIKSISSIRGSIQQKEDDDIDDIVELFNSMRDEMKKLNTTLTNNQQQADKTFEKLGEVFGENQYQLKKELESLNKSLNEKQDVLINEFHEFGQKMAQNNTDALIDALNDVIKDFNNKISEQFGENFKELNVAVTKLLDWQENYKDTIELTTNQLKKTVESIHSIDNSLSNMSNSSISLIKASESVNKTLDTVSDSQEKVIHGLSSVVEISERAKQSIPVLEDYFKNCSNHIIESNKVLDESIDNKTNLSNMYLEKLCNNISNASKESLESITTTINEGNISIKSYLTEYVTDLQELTNEFNKTIPKICQEINDNYKTFTNTLDYLSTNTNDTLKLSTEQIKAQCETLEKTNSNLRDKLNIQLEQIHEDTMKQIATIVNEMEKIFADRTDKVNEMLEHELKESLNSLGTQLATLSGRFVEDYMPLTDRLKDIVNIAQGV